MVNPSIRDMSFTETELTFILGCVIKYAILNRLSHDEKVLAYSIITKIGDCDKKKFDEYVSMYGLDGALEKCLAEIVSSNEIGKLA